MNHKLWYTHGKSIGKVLFLKQKFSRSCILQQFKNFFDELRIEDWENRRNFCNELHLTCRIRKSTPSLLFSLQGICCLSLCENFNFWTYFIIYIFLKKWLTNFYDSILVFSFYSKLDYYNEKESNFQIIGKPIILKNYWHIPGVVQLSTVKLLRIVFRTYSA